MFLLRDATCLKSGTTVVRLGISPMLFKPRIGRDLPIETVKAETKHLVERTRSTIALWLLSLCLLVLVGAGSLGLLQGNFSYLATVWSVIAAPSGWIIGHYFRGNGNNGEEDNEGTA